MSKRTLRFVPFVTTGASQDVLPPNPHRVGLILQGANGSLITYGIGEDVSAIAAGLTVAEFRQSITIWRDGGAENITGKITAFGAAPGFQSAIGEYVES